MPSLPSRDQVCQTLQNLANTGGIDKPVRLSGSHQLKTDKPKVNWMSRTIQSLTPQKTVSSHGQQEQKAVDLIGEYSNKSLSAREITVGQALLLLQSPASDKEFLEYVNSDQLKLDTDIGKIIFNDYLEQKISNGSEHSVGALGKVNRLIEEIPDSSEAARTLADQWLISQKMKLLDNTPACEKVVQEVLSTPDSSMGKPSFDDQEYFQHMRQVLPDYLQRVEMVANLPASELETLKKTMDEKGVPPLDPLYQSTLAHIASASGQNPDVAIKTTIESYHNYLTLIENEKQAVSQSLEEDRLELKKFEEEKATMSNEDIQESLWVGHTGIRIASNENRLQVLSEWSDFLKAELKRLNSE
ncbi:hypothetical protein [Endozoicomonas sp. SCSIO W0465]|uniref:hypothetical protein n=1 Tax=Endozoicomonas sp. SCSIO W0465 TaxID=2918516 RepID=UPI002075C22D|nr:hypothetical protein [Endozoicomonas sp. SCSIO W0465]USE36115.1 hypothetical protein MJO57_29405 [Endozoicomonas sp. SCSIO W0465]